MPRRRRRPAGEPGLLFVVCGVPRCRSLAKAAHCTPPAAQDRTAGKAEGGVPELRSLELFYWVAELRSFSRAAERLNTTQPAVSQRIANLEAELGVRVLDRSARTVTLTPQGRTLFDFAERFLRLRADMLAAMATPGAFSGLLRLGVAETIVQTWLSRFIERAHALYPNVTIDLTVDVSPTMQALLLGGELDLVFLLGPVAGADAANLELSVFPLAFIAAPGLALGPEPLGPAALRRIPIITYPRPTQPHTLLRRLLADPSLPPPRIFGNSSLTTIVRMTLDRIGLSLIPPAVVARELAEGTLRQVQTTLALPPLVFMASYRHALAGGLAAPLAALAREVATEWHGG